MKSLSLVKNQLVEEVLSKFPPIKFAAAYGSAVFTQKSYSSEDQVIEI